MELKSSHALLTLFASAMAASHPPTLAPDGDESASFLDELVAQVETVDSRVSSAEPATARRQEPVLGLRTSGLVVTGLQPSSGLGSLATGLTPTEDWRRMFPSKAEAQ